MPTKPLYIKIAFSQILQELHIYKVDIKLGSLHYQVEQYT